MWGSSWEEITAAAGGGRGEWGEGVSGKVILIMCLWHHYSSNVEISQIMKRHFNANLSMTLTFGSSGLNLTGGFE